MTKSTTCFRKTGGPLTEYSSKDEAMQGAEHANSTYSQDLTPYHCDKCSKWHLSPNITKKSKTCFRKTGEALTEYSSKDEAMQGAEHANSTYSQDLTPYHCDKCSKWHLSPKTRITPSETCNLCTDRDGKNKKLYFEEAAAQKRAQIIFDEEHIKLRVYKCKFSEGWHLTKDS